MIGKLGRAEADASLEVDHVEDEESDGASSLLSVALAGRSSAPRQQVAMDMDIIGYWRLLAADRRMPAIGAVEEPLVRERWPRTVLLYCRWQNSRPLFDVRSSHLWDRTQSITLDEPDYEALSERLITLAQAAARGAPASEVETFSHGGSDVRLRVVALPFADDGRTVDHVLCEVRRLE